MYLLVLFGDGDVSTQSGEPCPSYRTLSEPFGEGFFIKTSEFLQPRSECRRQRLECRISGRFRAQIEGADIQAIVASEDAVSHACGEVVGYFFASGSTLDRQIGDAAIRIDDVGLSDGLSGAGLNAQ